MTIKKFIHKVRQKFPLTRVQKIFFGVLVFGGFLMGFFISQIIITFSDLQDIKPLENYSRFAVPTKVYDIHNNLITEFFKEKRELISYKDLPDCLIKAIIAIEDNKFYSHNGFNPVAMIKGVLIDPFTKGRQRGGSTLTQQLAKGLFTTGERNILRKFVELWYAFQIEKKYSKDEILELYLNQVYFGHGCHGVQSAAHYFFDKDVKDLTLGEASLLAGLVNAPTAFSPIFQPYKAQVRHRAVLNAMVKEGFITKELADETFEYFWENYSTIMKAKDISMQRTEKNYAPYFTEYVRMMLVEKYGEDKLYSAGFQVYTSLDLDKQKVAQDEMIKGISNEQQKYDKEIKGTGLYYKTEYQDMVDLLSVYFGMDSIHIGYSKIRDKLENQVKNYDDLVYLTSFVFGLDAVNSKIKRSRYQLSRMVQKRSDQLEGALISINPANGYIEAMVGGSSFNYANQYNRATLAQRQMGSLFKALYYAIALDKKLITPATVYDDKPMIYEDAAGNLWSPRNYEGDFKGRMRVRQALQLSRNVVSVQIWDAILRTVGFNNVVPLLADYFGIDVDEARKRVEPSLSYALGVGTFTPYEVAYAFSIFANNGMVIKPIAILKVKDRYGRVIEDFELQRDLDKNSRRQIMSPGAAYLMQSMMQSVLFNGTGSEAVHQVGFNLQNAGGKTGTTPNWKDAWFAGFTKNLVTVVWFGFDDARKSMGRGRAAAVVAAPVWMRYMMEVSKKYPDTPFYRTDDVVECTVCSETGLLASPYCPMVVSEYFIRGTSPYKVCDFHNENNRGNDVLDDELNSVTNTMKIDGINLDHDRTNKKQSLPDDENLKDIKLDGINVDKGL